MFDCLPFYQFLNAGVWERDFPKKEGFVRTKRVSLAHAPTGKKCTLLCNRLNPLTLTRWDILSIRPMNAEKAGIVV